MKTKLPNQIRTIKEAKKFLTALWNNNEDYHPEASAHDIEWHSCTPTRKEKDWLDNLMSDVGKLPNFDASEFLLSLRETGHTFKIVWVFEGKTNTQTSKFPSTTIKQVLNAFDGKCIILSIEDVTEIAKHEAPPATTSTMNLPMM